MSVFIICLYSLFAACNLVCMSLLVARGQFYRLFPASLWLSVDLLVTAAGVICYMAPNYRFVYPWFMGLDTVAYVICLICMAGVALGGGTLARVFLGGMAALGAAKWLETLMWNTGVSRVLTECLNAVLVLLIFLMLIGALNIHRPLPAPADPQELPASVWTGLPAPAAAWMRVPR